MNRRAGIAANFAKVRERVDRAAIASGRSSSDVTLVVVTKTFPAEDALAAVEAGATDLGENRVQEGEAKRPLLAAGGANPRWHLIGPLQSNKARRAVVLFDLIQAVDSLPLCERLSRLAGEENRPLVELLVEVNLGGEGSKAGVPPEALVELVTRAATLPRLRLAGLMAIPPPSESPDDVRPWVRQLRSLRDEIRGSLSAEAAESFRHLSIGMSADYAEAAAEGATLVRVGSAIFGHRA